MSKKLAFACCVVAFLIGDAEGVYRANQKFTNYIVTNIPAEEPHTFYERHLEVIDQFSEN